MFTIIKINNKENENINYKVKFEINSIPYYILNLNSDIEKIKSMEKVSDICFPNILNENLIEKLSIKLKDQIKDKIDIIKIFNKNKKSDIITCPYRDNIFEYIKWHIESIDNLINELNKGNIIEIPIFNIKIFYSILLSKLNNKKCAIFKSIFFDKYIDCLYMYIINEKINETENIIEIKSLDDFDKYMDNQWLEFRLKYINSISKVSQYIINGNYYGYESSKYEQLQKEFINKLNSFETDK
jgi:hypothetical protein